MKNFNYVPYEVRVNEDTFVDIFERDNVGKLRRYSAHFDSESIPHFIQAVLSVKSLEPFSLEAECSESVGATPKINALVTPERRYEF